LTRLYGIWSVLGIAPTRDERALKRAYHAKLRVTNPEDDPEGFQLLRAAYDQARQMAAYADYEDEDGEDQVEGEESPPEKSADDAAAPMVTGDLYDRSTPPLAPTASPARQEDEEVRAIRELLDQFCAQLEAPGPLDVEKSQTLLAQLLSDRNLERFDILELLDQRLAAELAGAIPRSDPLLASAAEALQWPYRNDDATMPQPAHDVLGRLKFVAYLDSLESGSSEESRAWRKLREPPRPVERWLTGHVLHHASWPELQLLQKIDEQHPDLLAQLDPANVAWWRRFAQRPRISGPMILVLLMFSLIGGLVAGSEAAAAGDRTRWLFWAGGTFGLVLLLELLRMFFIEWPIVFAQRLWGHPSNWPLAVRAGWIGDCLLLPVLALLARDIPWLAWSFAGFAVLTLFWACVAAGPTRSLLAGVVDDVALHNSRILRVVFRNVFIGGWAWSVMKLNGADLGWPLMITACASLAASGVARERQAEGFAEWLPLAGQRVAAGAALLLTLATLWLVAVGGEWLTWRPTIFVATIVCVLSYRCVVPEPRPTQGPSNLIWIAVLFFGVVQVFSAVSGGSSALDEMFAGGWHVWVGAWLLLGGVAIRLAQFLWRNRPSAVNALTAD
jgi:hypothetical protein